MRTHMHVRAHMHTYNKHTNIFAKAFTAKAIRIDTETGKYQEEEAKCNTGGQPDAGYLYEGTVLNKAIPFTLFK